MEYETFETDFIKRTLVIIDQYKQHVQSRVPLKESFEVTLLLNCLLGLLVLPKERFFNKLPQTPIEKLEEWGFRPEFIKSRGSSKRKTLADLVHRMRNSVAHLKIEAQGNGSEITAIQFKDLNGFEALVPVGCLRTFVEKLARTIVQ